MPEGTCTHDGCDSPCWSRGQCRRHYGQWYRAQCAPCTVDGCDKSGTSRGMCGTHYSRWRKHGDTSVVLRSNHAHVDPGCGVDHCEAKHYACGLCKPHYRQRPDQAERAKQYEQERRANDPDRQESERQRNRRRRHYLSAWLRQRNQNMVIVDMVIPAEVFQRDGHRCQLCGIKTRGKFPAPTSPTVDHIVPVSVGGEHSYRNVQTACLSCNSRKGNRSANDQLRLIG